MSRIAQPLCAARMARRKRFEHLRKPPRQRPDSRKVDAGQYKAKGCIPPQNRSIPVHGACAHVCNRWQPSRRRVVLFHASPKRLALSARCVAPRMRGAVAARANDLLLCVRPAANVRMARASRCVLYVFSAAGERIPVERCFFRAVSSFTYWRRAAVALHFALPTGSADPTPPTNTEHITHGKNRR
ncbi:hypothetical protein KOJCDNHJ_03889 [Xanthomonas citri pv. punicae]|nr:hypothetical protein KOJCDNHJ_03889 [Xanthomonas citri pv. punicae]